MRSRKPRRSGSETGKYAYPCTTRCGNGPPAEYRADPHEFLPAPSVEKGPLGARAHVQRAVGQPGHPSEARDTAPGRHADHLEPLLVDRHGRSVEEADEVGLPEDEPAWRRHDPRREEVARAVGEPAGLRDGVEAEGSGASGRAARYGSPAGRPTGRRAAGRCAGSRRACRSRAPARHGPRPLPTSSGAFRSRWRYPRAGRFRGPPGRPGRAGSRPPPRGRRARRREARTASPRAARDHQEQATRVHTPPDFTLR